MAGLVVYSSPDTHLTVLEIPHMETDVSVSVPTECFRRTVDMLELTDTLVSIHGTVAKVTLEAARKGVSASVSFGATEVQPCPASFHRRAAYTRADPTYRMGARRAV